MGSFVPDDVLEEILLRVPVRHLLRFKCVSKSWFALINDCGFINKHYQIHYALCKADGDVPRLLNKFGLNDPDQLLLLSKHQDQGDVVLNLTPNLHRDGESALVLGQGLIPFDSFTCYGVVNGVVCLEWPKGICVTERGTGLWNPATREFKVLPRWPRVPGANSYEGHGFGFDPVTNDFKIVGSIITYLDDEDTKSSEQYVMYSLSTNSWKRIGEPPVNLSLKYSQTDAYLNGLYYWAANEDGRVLIRSVILSFDFNKEIFEVFDLPVGGDICAMAYEDEFYWKIGLYMERLAVFVGRHDYVEDTCTVDVWVVRNFNDDGECGVQLSWQRLLTIGQIPSFDGLWVDAFRMDGDLIVALKMKKYKVIGDCFCHLLTCCLLTCLLADLKVGRTSGPVEVAFELDEEMVTDDEDREQLQEIINNSKLSECYLTLARDIEVMEPKSPEEHL